ncbi:MAG: hypothetical protein GVY13_04030 [Alphaproteobacteria bacterium]|jgi:hypothetical protein|nr:hypothetical protein [Alphaproteobacteria bacterium]
MLKVSGFLLPYFPVILATLFLQLILPIGFTSGKIDLSVGNLAEQRIYTGLFVYSSACLANSIICILLSYYAITQTASGSLKIISVSLSAMVCFSMWLSYHLSLDIHYASYIEIMDLIKRVHPDLGLLDCISIREIFSRPDPECHCGAQLWSPISFLLLAIPIFTVGFFIANTVEITIKLSRIRSIATENCKSHEGNNYKEIEKEVLVGFAAQMLTNFYCLCLILVSATLTLATFFYMPVGTFSDPETNMLLSFHATNLSIFWGTVFSLTLGAIYFVPGSNLLKTLKNCGLSFSELFDGKSPPKSKPVLPVDIQARIAFSFASPLIAGLAVGVFGYLTGA